MTISNANFQIERGLNTEFSPDCSVGGRISRCAGQILSFAPCMTRSLKVSVSTLALGTVVTTSLMGGGSIFSELHEN